MIHIAVRVISASGIDEGTIGSHRENKYPSLVGSIGGVISLSNTCVIGDTGDPPAVSNVIV